ncbi:MAG: ATP-binding protein, partial [Candidatus Binatia bacterium]
PPSVRCLSLAVVVAAWFGRFGPGVLATVFSAWAVFFFFREPVYPFSVDEPGDLVALLMFAVVSLCVILAIETMHRAQEASRQSEQKLAAELHATQRLQEISNELVPIEDTNILYEKILDTAMIIMSSHFASMQILYPERGRGGELRLIAHRGFTPQAAKVWEWVGPDSFTSCGEALRLGRRVIVPDLPAENRATTNDEVENYLEAGIRAAQSTPLYSRSGAMLGMLSTHWRERHEPETGELRLLDVLARLAADLIDRIRIEEVLRDADRRKDEFLALLGHELRNPLGVISTVVQLLRIDGPPDPRLQDYRTTLELQVKQMTRLLDDLLDVSRITRGVIRLKKEPCDLAVIVRQAVESHRPLAEEAGLYMEAQLPDETFCVTGDQARLAQIVGNLLYNAIKYTGRDGQITVQLTPEPSGKSVLLTVRDTGIGIEPDMLHRIFEPFVQADRLRAKSGRVRYRSGTR